MKKVTVDDRSLRQTLFKGPLSHVFRHLFTQLMYMRRACMKM